MYWHIRYFQNSWIMRMYFCSLSYITDIYVRYKMCHVYILSLKMLPLGLHGLSEFVITVKTLKLAQFCFLVKRLCFIKFVCFPAWSLEKYFLCFWDKKNKARVYLVTNLFWFFRRLWPSFSFCIVQITVLFRFIFVFPLYFFWSCLSDTEFLFSIIPSLD